MIRLVTSSIPRSLRLRPSTSPTAPAMVTRIRTLTRALTVNHRLHQPVFGHVAGFLRTMTTTPRFAPGVDSDVLGPKLHPLLTSSGGRWDLTSSGEGIERSFKFKTFAKTWVGFSRLPSDLPVTRRVLTLPGFHDGRLAAMQGQEPSSRVVQREFRVDIQFLPGS